MRSTLSIENETDLKLRALAERRSLSYKEVVNLALEKGLERLEVAEAAVGYRVEPFDAGLKPGIDGGHLNSLSDALEAGE